MPSVEVTLPIFLAARYSRKEEMKTYAEILRGFGHTITASWMDEPHGPNTQLNQVQPDDLRMYAVRDLEDIDRSALLIFFAEDHLNQPPRGGRHVEFGYALGQGKRIFVIGERENIYHFLPNVTVFPTFADLIKTPRRP